MRNIINISLPEQMATKVKHAVKKGSYGSTSEFFRDLLRAWMDEKLFIELNESRKEIAAGRGKVLRSLKSLR